MGVLVCGGFAVVCRQDAWQSGGFGRLHRAVRGGPNGGAWTAVNGTPPGGGFVWA